MFSPWACSSLRGESWQFVLELAQHVDDVTCWTHPVNQVDVFAHWPSVRSCFGDPAVNAGCCYRRQLLAQYKVADNPLSSTQAIAFLGDSYETASLWANLSERAGVRLICPFLDSRLVRLTMNIDFEYQASNREPKSVLKKALSRHVPPHIVFRRKMSFGQPVLEWLARGGELRPAVDAIGDYDFVKPAVLEEARARPNWFLYSLLCYDVWFKLFIEKAPPYAAFVGSS